MPFIGLINLSKINSVQFGKGQSSKLCIICGISPKTRAMRGLVYVTFEQPSYMIKTFKNLLLWNQKADDLETWCTASGRQVLLSL